MKPKSVCFIEPAGRLANVFEYHMRLPLLGTLFLGTILRQRGHHVRIINENLLGRPVDPFEIRADVYAITALTVSANRARFLASQLKRIYPESKVLVGGIHASLAPEEFADVADHVVRGEAEERIVELVEGELTDRIVEGSRIADLNALPLPDYSLLEGAEHLHMVPIMTSRGCPFDCNFCTVTSIFGRAFRMLSPERIVAEMEHAAAYFGTRDVFFYDDNFAANPKRLRQLCDLLVEKRLGIHWTAQVRADLARRPELVARMAEAGCRMVFIGFESIDDETLKALNKSQTRADIEAAIRTFRGCGMAVHGMFIFGEDHDTVPAIERTVEFATQQQIDTVQFMILTPFPGTRCYDGMVAEDRIFHRNWDYYNGMFTVFRPKQMGALQLQDATYRAYRRFYSLRRTAADTTRLLGTVLLDALVWEFRRAHRYRFDALRMRAGANLIVSRGSEVYTTYRSFLANLEQEKALSRAATPPT